MKVPELDWPPLLPEGLEPAEVDAWWMRRALAEARLGLERGDVPVGAVVVRNGRLLGSAHDGKELYWEPTAHAEVLAIRRAARRVADWRLDGATLYVTLEPCPMCAGALLHARLARVVYGAASPRWGALESAPVSLLDDGRYNHRVQVTRGVCGEEAGAMLREAFRMSRISGRSNRPSVLSRFRPGADE